MRLQTLYLLLACVVMLGGCSGCDDDPKPSSPVMKILSYKPISGIPDPGLGLNLPKLRGMLIDSGYGYSQMGINFEASDTTWEEYTWRFASGGGNFRQQKKYKVSTSFATGTIDTIIMTAYRKSRRDSIKAKKPFRILLFRDMGFDGLYRGNIYVGKQVFFGSEVSIEYKENYKTASMPYAIDQLYLVKGITKEPCNVDIPLYFRGAYSNRLMINDYGEWTTWYTAGATSDSLVRARCGFCGPILDYLSASTQRWGDSIEVRLAVHQCPFNTPVPSPTLLYRFKGRKQ